MIAANEKARWGSGQAAGRKAHNSLQNKNISKLYALVNKLAQRWGMNREEIEHAATIYAFAYRSEAPENVRILFSGHPSFYSEDAKILAAAFLIVFSDAFDRLRAIDGGMGHQTDEWKAANERYLALCRDPASSEVSRFWAAHERLMAFQEHTRPDAAKCWDVALALVGGQHGK